MAFEADGNGLNVWYGPRKVGSQIGLPGEVKNTGMVKTVVIDFTYDSLPTYSLTNAADLVIPVNSLILSARLEVLTVFAGGTSLAVGLNRNGLVTAIDADGLITDANCGLTAIDDSVGERVIGTGALVGAVSDATYDAQVVVAATGTFTAGKARLVIEFIPKSGI